jgi:outer membrane protein W
MKTIILLSFSLALTATAFTQINKGQFIIGGSMNLESTENNSSRNETYKSTNYFISPNIGYFIINKMAIGMKLDFKSYNSKSQNLKTHQINTSISPFLRYYFLPLQRKVNAFIDVGYIHEKSKWSSDSNPGYFVKAKGYYFSGGPTIFLTDQIAIEFTLGYKHTKSADIGDTEVNKLSSGFGLQIHFGKIKNKSKT